MQLSIAHTHAAAPPAGSASHRARLVVPPENFHEHSPFLLMAEDWFAPPSGFPTHPHRGMETVTLVLEGELAHRDHLGTHGVLHAGDVQFMTAGAGVLHSELPGAAGVHTLQLWLNLPAARKMIPARYADLRLADTPLYRESDLEVRVYAGELGEIHQPYGSTWPLSLFDIRLQGGRSFAVPLLAGARTFIYVLDGAATTGASDTMVPAQHVAWASRSAHAGSDADHLRLIAQPAVRSCCSAVL